MDFAKTTERVKAILTNPRAEWPVIAAEPASIGSLYTGYIAILAALPAIAGFIKGSLIGYSMLGITARQPIAAGIGTMLLTYLLALAVVYVMALIINALAPSFGGRQDSVQALKTIAYAWTAAWVAGIAVIVPWLGTLIALAGAIYAIYLLYRPDERITAFLPTEADVAEALHDSIVQSALDPLVVAARVRRDRGTSHRRLDRGRARAGADPDRRPGRHERLGG